MPQVKEKQEKQTRGVQKINPAMPAQEIDTPAPNGDTGDVVLGGDTPAAKGEVVGGDTVQIRGLLAFHTNVACLFKFRPVTVWGG